MMNITNSEFITSKYHSKNVVQGIDGLNCSIGIIE